MRTVRSFDPQYKAKTFADLLRLRSEAQPARASYIFLADGETESGELTYGELDRRARAIAAALELWHAGGERVLLLQPPGLDFIAALFGCFYAGAVAVPVPPPLGRHAAERVLGIASDARPQAALTSGRLRPKVEAVLREAVAVGRVQCLASDEIDEGYGEQWSGAGVRPDGLAVLQYTSGSTASPKGVMVSHANLIHNSRLISNHFRHDAESRAVSWLPPYHDMGLVGGILQPLFAGFRAWLMPPAAFLKSPFRWLEAVSRFRATASGGPNFAYDLCVERVTPEQRERLDLSSWRVAINGAERVRADTIERFVEAFGGCGFRRQAFYPCYGLAESTLFVASGGGGKGSPVTSHFSASELAQNVAAPAAALDDRQKLVGCGRVPDREGLLIVDPATRRPCRPEQVGEIWLSGPSVARGYWGRPDETAQTFGARLEGSGEGPFLRTGDLGFLKGGELFITGRLKDLIIIHGRNLYPQDIELTVERSHAELQPNGGAAFSVEADGEERLVVVQEVTRRSKLGNDPAAAEAVVAAICRAVQARHGLAVHAVVLIRHGSLPKTPSGKIQRHLCQAEFLRGTLSALTVRQVDYSLFEGHGRASSPAEEPAAPDPLQFVDFKRSLFSTPDSTAPLVADISSLAKLAADGEGLTDGLRPAAECGEDAVAIVGMACRFPGAQNPSAFWELLARGGDAITEIPPDRWDVDELYDPIPGAPGKMNTRWGGFIDGIDLFDPHFFDISPREAMRMDPQQRLLLEVAWEAFENSSQPLDKLAGTQTGVFIGIGGVDYSQLQILSEGQESKIDAYCGTGNAHSIAANRLSYLFDFRGPSLAIDTACSSSLAAVHLACESLLRGECDAALAAGVNTILSPVVSIAFSQARMLSPDGRCKTFDESADGYVRSEGCGAVVLRRLSDAVRRGDQILGVIRGSAMNQDGRTGGITAPNSQAQQAVIRQAMARAGLSSEQIGYIEAHGTGTTLGDFIELQALAALFPGDPEGQRRCLLGSVKANIGHLETASGVAGLIKVLLCLKHGEIPAQINLRKLNPHIDLGPTSLSIQTQKQPWAADGRRRLAGVSSFGFGGTNVHVIVEEPPRRHVEVSEKPARPLYLLPLSAKSAGALKQLALRCADHLTNESGAVLADFCHTAGAGRSHFSHRLAVVAASKEEMSARLRQFGADAVDAGLFNGQLLSGMPPKVGFLFTGQGSQYAGMGLHLYATQPTFREAFDECREVLDSELGRPLLDVIGGAGDASLLEQTRYTQPALFALEYSLARLWRSWGVEPDVLLGHSVGEYVAACIAGVFSLEDGLRLIAERARLMQELPRGGAMAAVAASEERVSAAIEGREDRLSVAAVNAPDSVVVAGEREAVLDLLDEFKAAGVSSTMLQVSHAFHSPLMEPVLEAFERAARRFEFRAPRMTLVSNLTGQPMRPDFIPDAGYWREHIRRAVRFADGVRTLAESDVNLFVEIGPNPVLLGLTRRGLRAGRAALLPSMKQGQDEWRTLLHSLGQAYTLGLPVDWHGFDRGYHSRFISLPNYPFARDRFWYNESKSSTPAVQRSGGQRNPLLGKRKAAAALPTFEVRLNSLPLRFLKDHRVEDLTPVPATAYLEMALAAATETYGRDARVSLREVKFHKMLLWREGEGRKVQVVLCPEGESGATFRIFGEPGGADSDASWTLHASGHIHTSRQPAPRAAQETSDLEELVAGCRQEISGEQLYFALGERGLRYGPCFRLVEHAWRRDGEALGRLKADAELGEQFALYQLHPALLDAGFHVLAAALPDEDAHNSGESAFLPVGVERVEVFGRPGAQTWGHAILRGDPEMRSTLVEGDVRILDAQGQLVAEVSGLRLQRLPFPKRKEGAQRFDGWFQEVRWTPLPLSDAGVAVAPGRWLIFADAAGFGRALAEHVVSAGGQCVVITPGAALKRTGRRDGREHFKLNPSRREDFSRLIEVTCGGEQEPFDTVVHLWALNAEGVRPSAEDGVDTPALVWQSALHLTQSLAEWSKDGGRPPRLRFVTRGAQSLGSEGESLQVSQSPLIGFGRVATSEHAEFRCSLIDLCGRARPGEQTSLLFRECLDEGREGQVAFRGGERFVARLSPYVPRESAGEEPDETHAGARGEIMRLEVTGAGSLDNVRLRPAARHTLAPEQVAIAVRAAGLNFRDIMKTLGIYPSAPGTPLWIGDECAGVVSEIGAAVKGLAVGQEVLAVGPASFSTVAYTNSYLVVPKPAGLSWQEAATIPIAFTTAYHALHNLGRLSKGERVLIHAGAGGVGLAALQVARLLGAEVFATAGSEEKRDYLRSLGVSRIMDSRSLDFADEVLEATSGEGVDVVLNSLAGEAITRSLAALRPFGRFLEIGKRDIYENSRLGLRPFQKGLSFYAIDMERVFAQQPLVAAALLRDVMRHFESGDFSPLPWREFPVGEAAAAFHHMAQRKNIGKIVLSLEGIGEPAAHSGPLSESDAPRQETGGAGRRSGGARKGAKLDPRASYLITGGTGDLGLLLARWLLVQGVRHVTLVGRREPSARARQFLEEARKAGAEVLFEQADVADYEALSRVVKNGAAAGHPLRGVIHAAGVLDDGLLVNQDARRFEAVMAPKVEGAWNLHRLTAEEDLDLFVLFSSVVPLLGSPGQSNYAAANSYLDALSHYRRGLGLPSLSINWGPWGEVGMAARSQQNEKFTRIGIETIPPDDGLRMLKRLLGEGAAQVVVLSADWPRLSSTLAAASGSSPLLSSLVEAHRAGGGAATKAADTELLREIMAAPPEQRQGVVEKHFREQLSKITGIELSRIDVQQPLTSFGFDSLMALELMYSVESGLGVKLPLEGLSQEMNISQLVSQALPLLGDLPPAPEAAAKQPTAAAAPAEAVAPAAANEVMEVRPRPALPEPQPEPRLAPAEHAARQNGRASAITAPEPFAPAYPRELAAKVGTSPRAPRRKSPYSTHVRPRFAEALEALKLDVRYVSASGDLMVYEEDDGRRVEVLDMLGGFGTTLFGHNHPEIVAHARELLGSCLPNQAQSSIRDASGRLAVALSEKLKAFTGREYTAVFANSGAEVIEAALKHAIIEYVNRIKRQEAADKRGFVLLSHHRRNGHSVTPAALMPRLKEIFGRVGRDVPRDLPSLQEGLNEINDEVYRRAPLFFALEKSFHGKTLGALSLTANADYREAFGTSGGMRVNWLKHAEPEALDRAVEAETHPTYFLRADASGPIELIERPWCSVVAAFVEPVQGEGGVNVVSREFHARLREAADRGGFPIVVDEIQTGLGRCGSFAASELQNLRGDYFAFAKSLGGGIAKVGALLVDRRRYQPDFGFIHTSTFAEDDFGSLLALKALEIFDRDALARRCAERGDYLLGRLRELQARHPSVIREVRGMGLLVGVELASQQHSASNLIKLASEQEILAFIAAGYLLNEERIRIGTTLSSPNTLRLEPSAYVSEQSLERVVEALGRLCRLVERANAGRLVRFLADVESRDDAEPIRDWSSSCAAETNTPGVGGPEVAFLGHFISEAHLVRWDPSLSEIPEQHRTTFLRRIHRVVKPAVTRKVCVRSASGEKVTLRMISWMTTSELLEEALRSGETQWILEQIDEAVEQAQQDGCRVVGFGGFISIISQNCKKCATTGIALTTGNAFTVGMGIEALRRAAAEKKIALADARLGAVGAAGNICSTYLRMMAEEVGQLRLIGRAQSHERLAKVAALLHEDAWRRIRCEPPGELRGLSKAIYGTRAARQLLAAPTPPDSPGEWLYRRLRDELGADNFVQITDDLSALSDCEIIVTASNTSSPIIYPEHLPPTPAVVCDISVPPDVSPLVARQRPDVLILRGGVVRLPDNNDLIMSEARLPPGHMYACMAETTLLGLERYRHHFSFGEISKDEVEWILEAGRKHGFELGYLMSDGAFL